MLGCTASRSSTSARTRPRRRYSPSRRRRRRDSERGMNVARLASSLRAARVALDRPPRSAHTGRAWSVAETRTVEPECDGTNITRAAVDRRAPKLGAPSVVARSRFAAGSARASNERGTARIAGLIEAVWMGRRRDARCATLSCRCHLISARADPALRLTRRAFARLASGGRAQPLPSSASCAISHAFSGAISGDPLQGPHSRSKLGRRACASSAISTSRPALDVRAGAAVLRARGYAPHAIGRISARLMCGAVQRAVHALPDRTRRTHWDVCAPDFARPLSRDEFCGTASIRNSSAPSRSLAVGDLLLALCVHGSKHRGSTTVSVTFAALTKRASLGRTARTAARGAAADAPLGIRLAHELLGAPLDPASSKRRPCGVRASPRRSRESTARRGRRSRRVVISVCAREGGRHRDIGRYALHRRRGLRSLKPRPPRSHTTTLRPLRMIARRAATLPAARATPAL